MEIEEISRIFAVSEASIRRYIAMDASGDSLLPGVSTGAPSKLDQSHYKWIQEELEKKPFTSSYDLCTCFNEQFRDDKVHRSTILRAMRKLGFTFKKTPVAPQRDREDVAAARAQFLNEQRTLPAENLIFIDESGCHPGIGPRRGWSLKGKPLFEPEQVYARKQHVSIIGAISLDGLIAKATLRGGVGSGQFYRFVERQLVPVLRPGHIVCMDNLNAHKNKRVRQLIEAAGATSILLPPYSPDFNPIEAAWAKVKHLVRKSSATTPDRLRQAIYRALNKLTPADVQGYFRYCGYNT